MAVPVVAGTARRPRVVDRLRMVHVAGTECAAEREDCEQFLESQHDDRGSMLRAEPHATLVPFGQLRTRLNLPIAD